MLSPNEGPAQIEESCSHGMPYCGANSSMGAVVLGISRNRILRKSSARTASVKQSFQGIAPSRRLRWRHYPILCCAR